MIAFGSCDKGASDITIFQKPNVTDIRSEGPRSGQFFSVSVQELSSQSGGFSGDLPGGGRYIRAKPQQRIGADGDISFSWKIPASNPTQYHYDQWNGNKQHQK
ncbi:Uncharacterised protein [Salmonella enterica subsp. enterica]|nr:Uncharacterised protein [Salmonella enterica subsp. enterica] [Salmonella enterica subsp. enterica serovar Menston]